MTGPRAGDDNRSSELERRAAELDARELAVARREAAARKRELASGVGAPGVDDLMDLEVRAYRLQEFHDRVSRSAWYRVATAVRRAVDVVFPWGTRRRQLIRTPVRAGKLARREGAGSMLRHLLKVWVWVPNLFRPALPVAHSVERYEVWHRRRYRAGRRRAWRRRLAALRTRPTFSILMPAYNSERRWLRTAVGSIRAQVYPDWELCIADDASTNPETRRTLKELAESDPRITVRFLEENRGISGSSNAALELASGDFVALVDHDDELKPDALLEVAALIDERPDLEYIYTDEDKRGPDGRLMDVFFKPDWSPDLLLSMNYLSHLSVFRRGLIERAGGFRSAFDGSQDYDLVLRVTEATEAIGHVPLPLYTWRVVPGSAAGSDDAKPWAYVSAKRALEDALRRRGVAGSIEYGPFVGAYRVLYRIGEQPSVTVLGWGGDQAWAEEIRKGTEWPSLEVRPVPRGDGFAAVMNAAVEAAAEVVVFMDAAARPIDGRWLAALVEQVVRPEVAVAGARLLGPDGSRAFQGVVVDRGMAAGVSEPIERTVLGEVVRNCSAVGGQCMAVRTDVFAELGGFDAAMGQALAAPDLCLRAGTKGHRVVFTPEATLGYEGAAEAPSDAERAAFRERWAAYRDPYYNPNLDPADPGTIAL